MISSHIEDWHRDLFKVFGVEVCLKVDSSGKCSRFPPEAEWVMSSKSYRGGTLYYLTHVDTNTTYTFDSDKVLKAPLPHNTYQAPCPCANDGFCYAWAKWMMYLRVLYPKVKDLTKLAIEELFKEDYRTFRSLSGSERLELDSLFLKHHQELLSGVCPR